MARRLQKGPGPLVSCRLDLADYATASLVGQRLRLGANGVGFVLHLDMNVIRFSVPLDGWPTGRGPNGRAAREARCRSALNFALDRFFTVQGDGGALVVNRPKRPNNAARAAITEVAARIAVACTTTHDPAQVARRQRRRQ